MAHRQFHRDAHAEERRQRDDLPHLNRAAEREHGERDRLHHLEHLGGNHHAVAVVAVRPQAGQRGQQQNWQIGRKAQHPEEGCAPRQPVDQPRERDLLKPVTDERKYLPAHEESEIGMAQGAWHDDVYE